MEVFDDLLSKEHLDRKDLQLIIEKIKVYEDHLEIRLKADMDCLLRCGELPREEELRCRHGPSGEDTVNFPDGTGDISTITIVQSAKSVRTRCSVPMLSVTATRWRFTRARTGRLFLKSIP